jgi:S-formylglutathione hydrolase FrmB
MFVTEVQFFSHVLGMRSTMNVLLPQRPPEALGKPLKKYPVLTLLHGLSDDHTAWMHWSCIERYAEKYNLAVVMPAVHNSWYTDMAHGGKYFTFLTEEVPAVTRELFPLSAERADNFVAGLSMGGYGAFKLALSCPEKYAAAASLSGALDMRESVKEHDDPENPAWLTKMRDVFGDLDQFPGSPHDLFALAKKVSKSDLKPKLFQYCGTDDFLYADNLRFRDFVRPLGFDYTYEETPGDHDWIYWDRMIQKVLAWLPMQ